MKHNTAKVICLILLVVTLISSVSCGIKVDYKRGTVSDKTFTSETFGIKMRVYDTWKYSTDEEISQAYNVGLDLMNDSNALKENPDLTMYECMAVDQNTGNNVIIQSQNIGVLAGLSNTAESFLEQLKTQMNSQTTIDYIYGDVSEVKLGENTYSRLQCNGNMSETYFKQYVYARIYGDYISTIIVTDVKDSGSEYFESMFS